MKTLNVLRPIGKFLLPLLVSLILLVALWYGFLKLYPQVGLVGKSPGDVWHYLVTGPTSEGARRVIFDEMRITLRDALIGFGVGLGAALVVAALFIGVPAVAQAFMPVAMLLRSVPLVAITPIIVLVFGRGLLGVTVMAAIVVFFPALVMIMTGLRSAPRQATELVVAYGGSNWTAMRMVAIPAALPSVFAAARVSVPGALIGALLGEWLGSGTGLGAGLIRAIPTFQYNRLWASIALVTVVSVFAYAVVGVLANLVLARFAPEQSRD
ncbi:ABC transporter permease subunit [Nocardia seriolae]|uniref:ABC transporter permease n=1 Tax=Nocardia seriolae TaxID=37332 RepID=A0A0B8NF67_9NOCA|nr:ABC transporter permease subunit [Nocardia seriolae]APA94311.1 Nitrate transport permease protein NrtB [Nocardia seriolae]MTJ60472.1 ABC transporter permease subunit [Nocardia seriolae]MTJ72476.1 ABC transporter permease subunit [Nocardia seriolae]MTJ84640.1 ABC transporter permease subunit [Nocardia seriolae]MTK28628.1 ABC transporter permease subunit [Nocardia seriolae]